MEDKPLVWIGSSLDEVREFPESVRRRAGFELRALQRGTSPSDLKPIQSVGNGVEEIRIRSGGAFRIFYVARFKEAVYVLHAFQKKSQKTPREKIELGRSRYQLMQQYRANRLGGKPYGKDSSEGKQ